MKRTYSIDRRLVQFQIDSWSVLGADLKALCQQADIVYPLAIRGDRIPIELFSPCFDLVAKALGDPQFMYHCIRMQNTFDKALTIVPQLTDLLIHCPTLEDIIKNVTRYCCLASDVFELKLKNYSGYLEVHLTPPDQVCVTPYQVEAFFYAYRRLIDLFYGQDMDGVVGVSFQHGPLFEASRYDQYFNVPVNFNAKSNVFVFSRRLLEQPFPTYDKEKMQTYLADAELARKSLNQRADFGEVVANIVTLNMARGDLKTPELAAQLGMSVRALQRRLKKERLSVRTITDEVRKKAALEEVVKGEMLTHDIAFMLGYKETRSFYRAFKQWTGTTPKVYQKEQAKLPVSVVLGSEMVDSLERPDSEVFQQLPPSY